MDLAARAQRLLRDLYDEVRQASGRRYAFDVLIQRHPERGHPLIVAR